MCLGSSLQQRTRHNVQTQYHRQPQTKNVNKNRTRPNHVRNFSSQLKQSLSYAVFPSIVQFIQCDPLPGESSKLKLLLLLSSSCPLIHITNTVSTANMTKLFLEAKICLLTLTRNVNFHLTFDSS